MFENCFFVLGIINNIFLISIFLLVKFSDMSKLRWLGFFYVLLALPAAYGVVAAIVQGKPYQYIVFLVIYIAFLILEGVYEYILKLQFRKNWKLLVPYLILYWSMNYGFIVMAWKNSLIQGGVILGLFALQLTANIISHTKQK